MFYDGTDLRYFARWTRTIPIEVAIALELGDAPEFDGICCVECGNRFNTECDHVTPHVARAGVERQFKAALLEVPSSQNGARSAGRDAQTSRIVTALQRRHS